MRNIFGINVTKGQKSEREDGYVFVTKTLRDNELDELEKTREKTAELEAQGDVPTAFKIVQNVFMFAWFVVFIGIFRAVYWGEGVSIAEGYSNAPYLFWLGGLFFAAWIGMIIYRKYRMNKLVESDAFQDHVVEAQKATDANCEYLSIPENAQSIDVLAERYVIKNGQPKHKDYAMTTHKNIELIAYVQNESFCLSDLDHVWEIPLASLFSIELKKRRAIFQDWYKDESPMSDNYKKFKLAVNQFGSIYSRYYRVEIKDAKGDFYLLVPVYDGERFMKMTGTKVTM